VKGTEWKGEEHEEVEELKVLVWELFIDFLGKFFE
jgi:hypothetical protein